MSDFDWTGLVGHDALFDSILPLIRDDSFPNVVLLHGRAGIGKSHVAGALAAAIFCKRATASESASTSPRACGACPACSLVRSRSHGDLLWIDGEGQTLKAEVATELSEFLAYAPEAGGKRVAVITDVDTMTETGVNKLLKTLEEPPQMTQIILTTSRRNRLLPTLRSRCVSQQVTPLTIEEIQTVVAGKIDSKDGNRDATEWNELARRFGYSPGKILNHLTEHAEVEDPAEAKEAKASQTDLLVRLLAADAQATVGTTLDLARQTNAAGDLKVYDLPYEAEIALNTIYRRNLSPDGVFELNTSPFWIKERRKRLTQIKKLAGRERVSLNAQLSLESLALPSGEQR